MTLQDEDLERKISLTAHQPRHIINGMIRITEAAKPSTLQRITPSSDLGNLDTLPLELLHTIFAMLDFKTLSDMTRTCFRGMEIVKSLPEYSDLMRYVPLALTALGKTRLVRHHSSGSIHATLLSADCVSCGQYGAFLFLPTCQRCCYHCLWRNQSFWVIPLSVAKRCFGLSAASAKTLPTMRSLPGKYHIKYSISRQRPVGLVCVGTAKRLALELNGSEEQMREDLEVEFLAERLSEKQYYQMRHLQRASISPVSPESHLQSPESNATNDLYCGMASVPFPYLAPGKRIERGFWCLGCERVKREWSPAMPLPDHLAGLLIPGSRADDVVNRMQDIARPRDEFLSHIARCTGAQAMIQSGTVSVS